MTWKDVESNLQWIAIGMIVSVLGLLVFGVQTTWHQAAIVLLAIVGSIEGYLIIIGRATITQFYIPVLPKSIDWPMAIIVPVILIVKAALMWHNKEIITVWWAVGAIVEGWIVAHLCSFERSEK